MTNLKDGDELWLKARITETDLDSRTCRFHAEFIGDEHANTCLEVNEDGELTGEYMLVGEQSLDIPVEADALEMRKWAIERAMQIWEGRTAQSGKPADAVVLAAKKIEAFVSRGEVPE